MQDVIYVYFKLRSLTNEDLRLYKPSTEAIFSYKNYLVSKYRVFVLIFSMDLNPVLTFKKSKNGIEPPIGLLNGLVCIPIKRFPRLKFAQRIHKQYNTYKMSMT